MNEKMTNDLTTLERLIEENRKAASAGEPVKVARACLSALVGKTEQQGNAEALAALMTSTETQEVALMFGHLVGEARTLLEKMSGGAGSATSTDEGDAIANRFALAIEAAWLEGEEADKVSALVDAWRESKPAKSKSSGTRGTGAGTDPLGYKVVITCTTCGESIASTEKDNLNSIRDQARNHHGSKHGGKFGKGDAQFDSMTEALVKVGMTSKGVRLPADERATSVAAGSYTVSHTTA